jgi:hypothetical protein
MNLRVVVVAAIAAMIAFAFAAWNFSTQKASAPPPSAAGGSAPAQGGSEPPGTPPEVAAPEATDPGVSWSVPTRWTIDLAQGMRVATYIVPGAGGEKGECAVYYFGPSQGGGVDANLQRWMGEFQPLEQHDVKKLNPGGMEVTRVVARGTYVAHSMQSGQAQGEKPNWALMGAIANGPKGEVFFKLTGPAATVDAGAKDFDGMLASLRKK